MKPNLIINSINRVSGALKSGEKTQKVLDDNSKFFVSHFKEIIEESSFFQLPMKFLRNILKQIDFSQYPDHVEMLKLVLNQTTKYHPNSALVLHSIKYIDNLNLTVEDCINIIGQLSNCELCAKMYKLHEYAQSLPQIDYDYEIEQQNKQIEKLKVEIKENEEIVRKHKESHKRKGTYAPLKSLPEFFISDIFTAALRGNLNSIRYLIEIKRVNKESRDENGSTILHIVTAKGYVPIMQYLIEEQDCDMYKRNKHGQSAIFYAVIGQSMDAIKYLFEEQHQNVQDKEDNGASILHEDSQVNLEITKYLCEKQHADVNAKDSDGLSVAFYAAQRNFECLKYLIEVQHAEISTGAKGQTLLHAAAISGNTEIVEYVMTKLHIKADSKDVYGGTPIMWAVKFKNLDIVKYMIEHSPREFAFLTDNNGYNLLHCAAYFGQIDIARYLIDDVGLRKESKTNEGNRPLHLAAKMGLPQVVLFFLSRSCRRKAKNNEGKTPYDLASNLETKRIFTKV